MNLGSKIIRIGYMMFGVIPLIWLLLVSITYFKVANNIGHFPTYNNPDSSQSELFLKYDSVWNIGLFVPSMWGMIIIPMLMIIHVILPKFFYQMSKLQILDVIYGYIGYLIFIIFWTISPMNHMIIWYMD